MTFNHTSWGQNPLGARCTQLPIQEASQVVLNWREENDRNSIKDSYLNWQRNRLITDRLQDHGLPSPFILATKEVIYD